MMLFYVVEKKHNSHLGPLINNFLFGRHSFDQDMGFYSQVTNGEIANYSKNIVAFPKLLFDTDFIVPEELKKRIDKIAVVKWRKVVFKDTFEYDWQNRDGFEIFEEHRSDEIKRHLQQGVDPDELELHVANEPGIMYREFEKKYRVEYKQESAFWEMVVKGSFDEPKADSFADVVSFQVEPELSFRSPEGRPFSLANLKNNGVMYLEPRLFAMMPNVFEAFKPYLEPEYFSIIPIEKSAFGF